MALETNEDHRKNTVSLDHICIPRKIRSIHHVVRSVESRSLTHTPSTSTCVESNVYRWLGAETIGRLLPVVCVRERIGTLNSGCLDGRLNRPIVRPGRSMPSIFDGVRCDVLITIEAGYVAGRQFVCLVTELQLDSSVDEVKHDLAVGV